jgi:hypothetical protein
LKRYEVDTPDISGEALEEIRNLKFTDLGGGVVVFHDVMDVDLPLMSKWIDDNALAAHQQRWKYDIDKNGVVYAKNEDGNKFSIEQVETVPVRVLEPVQDGTEEEIVKIIRGWEDSIYKTLIRYIDMFPLVVGTIWWRNRGHVLRYDPGKHLGLHNDNDTNYRATGGERYIPYGQVGARQTVAVLLYINDCVDSVDELDGTNYSGGELFFPYLNISHKAKKGDIIIFPTNYVASHGVNEVTGGTRYAYLEFFSQGSPDINIRLEVAEPDEVSSWCVPHWIDTVYDDYQKYSNHIKQNYSHLKENVNKIDYLVRNLEGEKGYINPLNRKLD